MTSKQFIKKRIMFTIKILPSNKNVWRVAIIDDLHNVATWGDIIRIFTHSDETREEWNSLMTNIPYDTYFWETPPLSKYTVNIPFEMVAIKTPTYTLNPFRKYLPYKELQAQAKELNIKSNVKRNTLIDSLNTIDPNHDMRVMNKCETTFEKVDTNRGTAQILVFPSKNPITGIDSTATVLVCPSNMGCNTNSSMHIGEFVNYGPKLLRNLFWKKFII